jgi:hypothetical protein
VKPYASVEAQGVVTVAADMSTITVDTVVFTVPSGFTLPTGLATGMRVRVRGIVATSTSTTVDLTRIRVKGMHVHAHQKGGGNGEGDQGQGHHGNHGNHTGDVVRVTGPVSGTTATTLTIAGLITFTIPSTMTLDPTVVAPAIVCARGGFDGTTLNLAKVRVKA